MKLKTVELRYGIIDPNSTAAANLTWFTAAKQYTLVYDSAEHVVYIRGDKTGERAIVPLDGVKVMYELARSEGAPVEPVKRGPGRPPKIQEPTSAA